MLPKSAEYALRAVACLALATGKGIPASTLANKTQIPRRYLHKILQDLIEGGLVRSRPGPGGGYTLTRAPGLITILDAVNAVAPLQRITHCPLGLPTHTRLCPLHRELDKAFAATEKAFSRVTIGELLHSAREVPLCDASQIIKKKKYRSKADRL